MSITGMGNARAAQALMIVDAQAGSGAPSDVLAAVGVLVDRARAANTPVLWLTAIDAPGSPLDGPEPGSPAWQIVDVLVPQDSEPRRDHAWPDVFVDTDVPELLADAGCSQLCLAGTGDLTLPATLFGAVNRGLTVDLVEDAVHCPTIDLEQLIKAASRPTNRPALLTLAEAEFEEIDPIDDEDLIALVAAEDEAADDADDGELVDTADLPEALA